VQKSGNPAVHGSGSRQSINSPELCPTRVVQCQKTTQRAAWYTEHVCLTFIKLSSFKKYYATLSSLKISSKFIIAHTVYILFFLHGATAPRGPGPPHYRSFTITLRHTTLGRTPLDERSARCRDLCLTIHNTHKRQTSMPLEGFEPPTPASDQPQTHALDCAASGIGIYVLRYAHV
jgi:hypothetical protein